MPDQGFDIPSVDAPDGGRLTLEQAFAVFGLKPGADRKRVRARYRRLAFDCHPDRNGSSEESFARFKRISRAYQLLEDWFGTVESGEQYGECPRCGRTRALHVSLERVAYCRDCLVSVRGRRYLPAPPVVIVSCGFAIVTLLASIVFLFLFLAGGPDAFGIASVASACGALISLAVTAILVGQVARRYRKY